MIRVREAVRRRTIHAGGRPGHRPVVIPGARVHRDVRGGGFRAAVFGVSDGLVSNVSLVLGTAGAHPGGGVVRLAGLAGLFGGAFSMAAGEFASMQAQREALEHELEVERTELRDRPAAERTELEHIYMGRGVTPEIASRLANELMADPETALLTHAREELGIDPDELGSPVQAAASSFFTFAFGAFVPLIPFIGGGTGTRPLLLAVLLTGLAAIGVGVALSHFTHRSKLVSAVRMLGFCAVAGAATFGIGSAIGVAAS